MIYSYGEHDVSRRQQQQHRLAEQTGDERLNYYYDGEGKLTSIGYVNGTSAEALYTVARNAQGDIVALYTSVNAAAPTLVGTDSYDAWGKITAVTPASETSDPRWDAAEESI